MKKILVVDDDKDIVDLVKMILTGHGYEVVTHYTGFAVHDVVKKCSPDLILLDINLPGKPGTEICRELKTLSDLPPILLFSARASEDEALAFKADGFIPKPFDINNFIEAVKLYAA